MLFYWVIMAKMTDDELRVLTDSEIRQSMGFMGGKLSEQRRKAEAYYLGLPQGDLSPPQVDGRSSVVSTDVADTIEWMLPSLLKIFTASDTACEFAPQKREDEAAARQATDYINYIFYKQNPGFNLLYTWFKDALLQKVGILKVYWDVSSHETREEYKGLTDEELTMLLQDENVEPVEHSQYPDQVAAQQIQEATQQAMQQYQMALQHPQPPMPGQPPAPAPQPPVAPPIPNLHDIALKRTEKKGCVKIEAVPPEEFGISKRSKHIKDGFSYHRVERTIGELKEAGYKNVDDLTSDDQGADSNGEAVTRKSFDDENVFSNDHDESTDKSARVIWITECYMPIDYDGDGIPEWRKIVRAGNQILENVECDGPPFVSITPIPLPHRFFGLSIADLAMESQRIKTSLLRSVMDNLYMSVNGRYFAVENQVNLDDLLTSRPGGIVRVKTPGAVGRLDTGASDPAGAYQMLEYVELMRENRTGYMRNSQGADNPNVLNKTATGAVIQSNRADGRIDLIARVFAETGVKDLFLLILKLVSENQDKAAVMRLNNEWVDIDPSEWKTQFDFTVNVGLGTGNKDQQVQHLMGLMQVQEKALQLGVSTPANIYNSAAKLAENMGFKNADAFFTDPSKHPQPPQPHPDQMKIQAEQQTAQAQIQATHAAKMAEIQANVQAEQAKQQFQAAQSQHQNELEAQREMQRIQLEDNASQRAAQRAAETQAAEMEFAKWKVLQEQATKITVAEIAAKSAMSQSLLSAEAAANATVQGDQYGA